MSPSKQHFAQASLELEQGQIDRGLWAMATARALGNKEQAAAFYLQFRAEELACEEQSGVLASPVEIVKPPFRETRTTRGLDRQCVGVDGARHGWIAVWEQGQGLGFHVYGDPSALCSAHCDADVIAVDIPIGLSDRGPRAPDMEARRFVGRRRASSIFPAPVRGIIDAATQPEASRRHRDIDGRGFGAQAFGILPKIRIWDELLVGDDLVRSRVYEMHPEVSFAALNGGIGLAEPKKSTEGAAVRITLLNGEFGAEEVQALLADCPRRMAATDDVLDALVALWTAKRISSGVARTLPTQPTLDSAGLRTAIYF
jgi:predicted RNase H-like nuclease